MIIPARTHQENLIFESPQEFQKFVRRQMTKSIKEDGMANRLGVYTQNIIMTSGGYDPIHPGHISYLQQAKRHDTENSCFHVAVVNGDNFLTAKKGKPFMDLDTRAKIVFAISGVDAVVKFEIEDDQTVIEALKFIQPYRFFKGGDRKDASSIPEWDICQELGIEVVFDTGIEKTQSSSGFIKGNSNGAT